MQARRQVQHIRERVILILRHHARQQAWPAGGVCVFVAEALEDARHNVCQQAGRQRRGERALQRAERHVRHAQVRAKGEQKVPRLCKVGVLMQRAARPRAVAVTGRVIVPGVIHRRGAHGCVPPQPAQHCHCMLRHRQARQRTLPRRQRLARRRSLALAPLALPEAGRYAQVQRRAVARLVVPVLTHGAEHDGIGGRRVLVAAVPARAWHIHRAATLLCGGASGGCSCRRR